MCQELFVAGSLFYPPMSVALSMALGPPDILHFLHGPLAEPPLPPYRPERAAPDLSSMFSERETHDLVAISAEAEGIDKASACLDPVLDTEALFCFATKHLHQRAEHIYNHIINTANAIFEFMLSYMDHLAQTSSAAPLSSAQTLSAATGDPEHPVFSPAALSGYTVAVAGSPLPHNATPYNSLNSHDTPRYLKYLYKSAWYNIISSILSQGL